MVLHKIRYLTNFIFFRLKVAIGTSYFSTKRIIYFYDVIIILVPMPIFTIV